MTNFYNSSICDANYNRLPNSDLYNKIINWVKNNLGVDLTNVNIQIVADNGIILFIKINYNFTSAQINQILSAFPMLSVGN